jgi:hypothetical protein
MINPTSPPYVDGGTAEFIYFDFAPAFGVLAGAVQIELAARTLVPVPDGGVDVRILPTARLRCSPTAAGHLRDALNGALQQLEELQQEQIATGSKLN